MVGDITLYYLLHPYFHNIYTCFAFCWLYKQYAEKTLVNVLFIKFNIFMVKHPTLNSRIIKITNIWIKLDRFGLTFIKLTSTGFTLILEKHPIRTNKYSILIGWFWEYENEIRTCKFYSLDILNSFKAHRLEII